MESNINIVSLALPTNYIKSFLPGKSPANVTQVCGSWQAMALAALRSGRTCLTPIQSFVHLSWFCGAPGSWDRNTTYYASHPLV